MTVERKELWFDVVREMRWEVMAEQGRMMTTKADRGRYRLTIARRLADEAEGVQEKGRRTAKWMITSMMHITGSFEDDIGAVALVILEHGKADMFTRNGDYGCLKEWVYLFFCLSASQTPPEHWQLIEREGSLEISDRKSVSQGLGEHFCEGPIVMQTASNWGTSETESTRWWLTEEEVVR
ncbi:hypothetical protein OH76DRAFT_1424330 [Lentinus brumalis]|uniref:Uncharacterized protein n=1 Tax=Lentinus brumalis TaxID=2498619 RepID=A0A371CGM0_9APHY|nr:hypothetical protein OH76DRAFT_1424330 [Polyporus brumalis]